MPAGASWVAALPTAPAAPLTTRVDAGAGASRPMTRWAVSAEVTRAAAPKSAKPATGSPAARFSMPSPTSRTVPAVSLPMTTGSGRGSVSAR